MFIEISKWYLFYCSLKILPGWGLINGPSGVCVTPNRTKKLAQAIKPLQNIKYFNFNQ